MDLKCIMLSETILKIVGSLLAKGEISSLRSLLSELNVVDTAAIMVNLSLPKG